MKKVKIFFLIMILSLVTYMFLNIENVSATSIESSTAGVENASALTCYVGGNCYSLGTGGIRVALLDKDGNKKGNIVDYWFVDSTIEFYSAKTNEKTQIVTLDRKYIKQELTDGKHNPSLSFTPYNDNYYANDSQKRYLISRLESGGTSTMLPSQVEHQDLPYESENGLLYAMTQKYCKGLAGLDPYEIHATNNVNNTDCVNWKRNNLNVGGETGYYIKSSVKLNVRNANAVETIVNRLVANGKGEAYNGQGNFNSKTKLYIDKIISDILSGTNSSVSSEDYLQIEPLTQWGNHGLPGSCSTGALIFIGTPSEYSYIVNNLANNGHFMDTLNAGMGGRVGYGNYYCAFNHYNAGMYFQLATYGVTAPKQEYIPNHIFNARKDNIVASAETYNRALTIMNNPKDSYGVSFIKLSEVGSSCTDDAVSYLSGNNVTYAGLASTLDNLGIDKSLYSWIADYKDYGFKDLKEVKDYLKSKSSNADCPKPTCDETAYRLVSKGSTKDKIIDFIKKIYGDIKSGEPGVANLEAYFTSTKLYNNEKNLCGAQTCVDLLNNKVLKGSSYDENALKDLSKLFPNYALLDADLVKELEINPRCENVNPCLVTPITPTCDANHIFSFKDATSSGVNSKCDLGKYAYNYAETNDKGEVTSDVRKASVQTSRDKAYGPEGYCREEVTFEFPKDVENVTGGSIMKWGTSSSKSNSTFGTMIVKRTCYIDSANVSSPFLIRSDWANIINSKLDINHNGRINPDIKMYYKEAVENPSEALTLSAINMDTYLTTFIMKVNGGKGTASTPTTSAIVQYDKEYNVVSTNKIGDGDFTSSYREFRCGGKCETIRNVEMTAEYEIDYPNRLKWYADSADNFRKKNATSVETNDVADAKYLALGYGLPTSFLTPTNFDTWYGKTSKESSGYMYVTLSQVGTKNTGSGYHFDKYIEYYVGDEYKVDAKTIKYSCGFSIQNILYDNECTDDTCGSTKVGKPTCEMVLGKKICGAGRTPKGLDVVFRTVELVSNSDELDKAFPGRSGTGRKVGENWNLYSNKDILETTDTMFKDVVTSILSKDVYNSEPKYVIELNTTNIQRIRKDNKNDSYTSMKNYEFVKRSIERLNPSSASDIANACSKQNKREECRKFAYTYRNYLEANGALDGYQLDYAYTYGASDFISDLISKGDLKGICATESDTKKRAELYAESYGC